MLKMLDNEVSFEDKREYGNKKGIRLMSYSLDDLQYDSLVPKEYVDNSIGNIYNIIGGMSRAYQIEEVIITQQIIDNGEFYLNLIGLEVHDRSVMITLNGVVLRNGCLSTVSNGDYEVDFSGKITLLNPLDFNIGDSLYIQYVYTPSGA